MNRNIVNTDLENECKLSNEDIELLLKSLKAYKADPRPEYLSIVNYNLYEFWTELSKYSKGNYDGSYVDNFILKLFKVLEILKEVKNTAKSDIVDDAILQVDKILSKYGYDNKAFPKASLSEEQDFTSTEGKRMMVRNAYEKEKEKFVKEYAKNWVPAFDKFDVIAQELSHSLGNEIPIENRIIKPSSDEIFYDAVMKLRQEIEEGKLSLSKYRELGAKKRLTELELSQEKERIDNFRWNTIFKYFDQEGKRMRSE